LLSCVDLHANAYAEEAIMTAHAEPIDVALDPNTAVNDAFNHVIFPLIHTADVRDFGPNIYVKGEGVRLTDVNGNTYLDMMSSHTRANSLGYGNEEVARAIYDQLRTLHYIGTVNNLAGPTIALAKKIASLAPGRLSRIMFVSGGSEAVESAIKVAKQYHVNAGRKPRAHKIISRWNAYHGATMGALAVTDWLNTRHIAEPGVPGGSFIPGPMNYRNPFNMGEEEYAELCATYLEQQILHEGPELVAAFIAEPVMQAHGVQVTPKSYFQRVREICDKYDVLWINDEVITGFGRTGNWFAIERMGVEPDIMTMAKAMTAGYMPMGAVITRPEIADTLPIFRHVHTFSGHAGASAAALTVIGIKERDGLIAQSRDNGAYVLDALKQALEPLPIVGQARGAGMWLAVDFTKDKSTKEPFTDDTVPAIVRRMYKYGVIASAIGTSFEIAPPLITTRSELDELVRVAGVAIREIIAERQLG
jgi:adenosylmethionine-8-amino-7-oxononanoate aminotransferase